MRRLMTGRQLMSSAEEGLLAMSINSHVPGPSSMAAGASDTNVTSGRARTGTRRRVAALSTDEVGDPDDRQDPLLDLERLLRHSALSDVDRTRVIAVAALSGVTQGAHDASGLRSAALREWLVRMPLLEGGTLADRVGLPQGEAPAATVEGPSIASKLVTAFVKGMPAPIARRMGSATAATTTGGGGPGTISSAGPGVITTPLDHAPTSHDAQAPAFGQGQRANGLTFTLGEHNLYQKAFESGISEIRAAAPPEAVLTTGAPPAAPLAGAEGGAPAPAPGPGPSPAAPAKRGLGLPAIIGTTVAATLAAQMLVGAAMYGARRAASPSTRGTSASAPSSAVQPAAPAASASTTMGAKPSSLEAKTPSWPNVFGRIRRRLSGLSAEAMEAGKPMRRAGGDTSAATGVPIIPTLPAESVASAPPSAGARRPTGSAPSEVPGTAVPVQATGGGIVRKGGAPAPLGTSALVSPAGLPGSRTGGETGSPVAGGPQGASHLSRPDQRVMAAQAAQTQPSSSGVPPLPASPASMTPMQLDTGRRPPLTSQTGSRDVHSQAAPVSSSSSASSSSSVGPAASGPLSTPNAQPPPTRNSAAAETAVTTPHSAAQIVEPLAPPSNASRDARSHPADEEHMYVHG